jgi:hypothetical protein
VPYRQHNLRFHNDGHGLFRNVSSAAGAEFSRLDVGRGLATGDVDNDGDVDMVITNNSAPARLLLNGGDSPLAASRGTVPTNAHWLELALSASTGNRYSIGARVGIVRQGQPTLWRRVRSDGSYLSASDDRVHFGLGTSDRVTSVTVEWPDGRTESFEGIRITTLKRGTRRELPAPTK